MYIGIDLGTTCCKCILYDCDGKILSAFHEEMPIITKGLFVEQDAGIWWQSVKKGLSQIIKRSGCDNIKAISVSTQGISFVPVNNEGNPVYNAISWLDERAEEQVENIKKYYSDEQINSLTGIRLKSCYSLPKILWLKDNKKDVYSSSYKLLMPLDFINNKLTGRPVTDYTIAGGTMIFNIKEKQWDSSLLNLFNIDKNKLPEVMPMGSTLGKILPGVAEEIKINKDAEIILGGQDQKLAAIGGGIDSDTVTVSFGTSSAVSVYNKQIESNKFLKFALNENEFICEGVLNTSGASIKWLKELLGLTDYKEMDELAVSVGNSDGVMIAPEFNKKASIRGLNLSHSKGHIIYALYEGISKQLNSLIKGIKNINKIIIFGGGARSDILCMIMAKTVKKDIFVLDTVETAALGAAVLASDFRIKPAEIKKRYTWQ